MHVSKTQSASAPLRTLAKSGSPSGQAAQGLSCCTFSVGFVNGAVEVIDKSSMPVNKHKQPSPGATRSRSYAQGAVLARSLFCVFCAVNSTWCCHVVVAAGTATLPANSIQPFTAKPTAAQPKPSAAQPGKPSAAAQPPRLATSQPAAKSGATKAPTELEGQLSFFSVVALIAFSGEPDCMSPDAAKHCCDYGCKLTDLVLHRCSWPTCGALVHHLCCVKRGCPESMYRCPKHISASANIRRPVLRLVCALFSCCCRVSTDCACAVEA